MRAMIFEKVGEPLRLVDLPIPHPSKGEVLIKVHTCGVCRTDRHIFEGELTPPHLPLILGHQVIGVIAEEGPHSKKYPVGTRVGVAWLGWACEHCSFCLSGRENLCDKARYTGYHVNGGFAEYCVADERFIFPIPECFSDAQAAPLLCGGMIGFRSLRFTKDAHSIGFYGFGSSAHLLIQVARFQKKEVYVFTRPGDVETQQQAKKLGAAWCGSSEELPPKKLEAAIIFASEGHLIPKALQGLEKGGIVVCAGIHMSDIPSFPYSILWNEKEIRSVANLTRVDGQEFLSLAAKIPIQVTTKLYPLDKAGDALNDMKLGKVKGSAVINIRPLA